MRSPLLFCLGSALMACATAAPPQQPPEPQPRPTGACDREAGKRFIGEVATTETGADIQAATGAQIFQWVPPDSAVTMDYREDRVRVSYDRDLVITAVRCG